MSDFYDRLSPLYHLIYQDWEASLEQQGEQLSTLIESQWPGSRNLLDVSCGIGTQSIALAARGYRVTASDLSATEVERAGCEAAKRDLKVRFSECDMRGASAHHGTGFHVVLSCDNSLPHLLSDSDLLRALEEMLACLAVGGGCVLSVRDYELEEQGRNLVKPYGVREEGGKRYLIFQVWDFEGEFYDLAFFFVEEDISTHQVTTHVMRTRYYAITTDRLLELMSEAGFQEVQRIDGAFFQPVLVGTKPG